MAKVALLLDSQPIDIAGTPMPDDLPLGNTFSWGDVEDRWCELSPPEATVSEHAMLTVKRRHEGMLGLDDMPGLNRSTGSAPLATCSSTSTAPPPPDSRYSSSTPVATRNRE